MLPFLMRTCRKFRKQSVIYVLLIIGCIYMMCAIGIIRHQHIQAMLHDENVRAVRDKLWGFVHTTTGITSSWNSSMSSCEGIQITSASFSKEKCFLKNRLQCGGNMPTIHSSFVDIVDKRVVFIAVTFSYERWEKETFVCEFSDGLRTLSDPTLNDTRSFGAQPQYVLVITCPLPKRYVNSSDILPSSVTLRRTSNPRFSYANLPLCKTGILPNGKPRFLSLCTMVKDMDDFFNPWLLYYRYMGVEHVYIYDNGPDSKLGEKLLPFIEVGFVTVIPWAHKYTPTKTYLEVQIAHENDCMWRHRHDTTWMLKVDVDEFVQPLDPRNDTIVGFLNNFGEIPDSTATLRIRNWFFSKIPKGVDHEILHAGTVIERNPWRQPDPTEENRGRDKCLALPQKIHYFKIHGVKIGGDTITLSPWNELRLVHYRSENPHHRNFRIHKFIRDDSMRDLWRNILYWKDSTHDKVVRHTFEVGKPVRDVDPYPIKK